MKPWGIQRFVTFDSMEDKTRKCDHSLESCLSSSCLLWCRLFFNFTQFVILENLSNVDIILSGVSVVAVDLCS